MTTEFYKDPKEQARVLWRIMDHLGVDPQATIKNLTRETAHKRGHKICDVCDNHGTSFGRDMFVRILWELNNIGLVSVDYIDPKNGKPASSGFQYCYIVNNVSIPDYDKAMFFLRAHLDPLDNK